MFISFSPQRHLLYIKEVVWCLLEQLSGFTTVALVSCNGGVSRLWLQSVPGPDFRRACCIGSSSLTDAQMGICRCPRGKELSMTREGLKYHLNGRTRVCWLWLFSSFFALFQESVVVCVLPESSAITGVSRNGTTNSTRRPTWALPWRLTPSEEPLTPRGSYLRKCKYHNSS